MDIDYQTIAGVLAAGYIAKFVVVAAYPLENMGTRLERDSRIFELSSEVNPTPESVDELARLNFDKEQENDTQKFGWKFFALPTPLDVVYGAYTVGKATVDYFRARSQAE